MYEEYQLNKGFYCFFCEKFIIFYFGRAKNLGFAKEKRDGFTYYSIPETMCCGNYVEWKRGEAPEVCPFCGDKYYQRPGLEYKLFHLQDIFLDEYNKTGSTKILGEKMFPLIQEYAENIIKGLIKGKKSLSAEELRMRAYDAGTLLLEVILKDPEHRMRYSFGKYLGNLCKSVCYSTKNYEHTYSLNSILRDGETELGEMVKAKVEDVIGDSEKGGEIRIDNVFEMDEYREDAIEKIMELVEKTADALYDMTGSFTDKLLYMQGLLMKFGLDDDKVMSGFFEEVGGSIKNYVEKGELLIFNELLALTS